MSQKSLSLVKVEKCILEIRNRRVILDAELAELYGVETRVLVQAVKRNACRFPEDFIFQLDKQEVTDLKSQNVISSSWGGRRRSLPYAFTEHGAVMTATVLKSPVAVDTSIMVVRAFMRLRELALERDDLKKRLHSLEASIAKRFSEHEEELREIRFLIARLEEPIPHRKSPIGFRPPKK
jgi:phage regulator Rha-like protein